MDLRSGLILLTALTISVSAEIISMKNVSAETLEMKNGKISNGGKIWAFLVAGSDGYFNYRHQADICHAYQLLKNNGLPEDQIIVMMVDDVAHSKENPTPGVIINKLNGTDVYEGVKIDYKGDDVNPSNFLAVLQGNKEAVKGNGTGRVIESGPKDHIFVNYADHGGPGLLVFPTDYLMATTLNDALRDMAEKNKFHKMALYIEACHSGSMFHKMLPDNIKIFAVTAANPHESSYACYWDETREAFLGDLFSVNWMEHAEIADLSTETLMDQFEVVRNATNASHVMGYGDRNISSQPLELFIGCRNEKTQFRRKLQRPAINDAVPSYDVPMEIFRRKLQSAVGFRSQSKYEDALQKLQKARASVDVVIDNIIKLVAKGNPNLEAQYFSRNFKFYGKNQKCYEATVQHFDKKCFRLPQNSYVIKHLFVFINMCSEKEDYKDIFTSIDKACEGVQITNVN